MTYTQPKQNDPELLTHKYILGFNKSKTGHYYEYKGFNKHKQINEELQKGLPLFELITGTRPVKPYIDFDELFDRKDSKNRTPKEALKIRNKKGLDFIVNNLKPHMITRLSNIFIQACINVGIPANDEQLLIIDGSRIVTINNSEYYKMSFHITLNNKYVFKTTADVLKVFIPALKCAERELYNSSTYYEDIDPAVYGKTQRLRTIYSPKTENDKNVFIPINKEGQEIKTQDNVLYLVQYFKDDYILVNVPTIEHKEVTEPTDKKQEYEHTDKNVYTQDILKLLHKHGMNTASIPKNGIDRNTNTNQTYYKILYNPDVNKCIYGNEHDRPRRGIPVCHAYIFNGQCYVGCWGSKCKTLEKVNIGTIIERSPMCDPSFAVQVNERYLTMTPNNKVNQLCEDFIKDPTKKALVIKSETGTGKTYLLTQYITMYEQKKEREEQTGARVIVISTRRSYSNSICDSTLKQLNIVNYLDYKENKQLDNNLMYKVPKLCLSMESLQSLLLNDWRPYDIVVIDEAESVCRHLYSATVKSGSYGAFKALRKLIEYSKKVILLDADAGTPTMTLINNINNDSIVKINNNFKKDHRQYFMTKNKEGFVNELKANIEQKVNQYIVCLSKNEADALQRTLTPFCNNDYKIICITADSDTKTKKGLGTVNTLWTNYNTVITTSTTGAGVDYNVKDHFNNVYGYASAGSCPPVEFIQILDRVRYPTTKNVKILIDSSMCIPTNDTYIYTVNNSKYYIDELNKNTEVSKPVNNTYYDHVNDLVKTQTVYEVKNTDYSMLTYYNYLSKYLNNGQSNYILYLKLLLEQRGHTVTIDEEKHKQVKAKIKPHERYNDINVKEYTAEQLQKIYYEKEKTEKSQKVLKKVDICNVFNIHKSKRDHEDIKGIIDTYHTPTNKSAIKLILKHFVKNEHCDIVMNPLKEHIDENDKIRQNKMNMFSRLMEVIKYDYTNNYTIDIPTMDNILKEYKTTPTERKSISRTQLDEYKTIQTILKKYGLNLTKKSISKRDDTGKVKKCLTGYNIVHDNDLYNCIYLLVKKHGADKFDNNLITLCNDHTEYERLTHNRVV